MNRVFVFPGQGSQHVEMAKDLYDNFDVARKVFEEADDILKQKISDLILNGPENTLTLTENAQPALVTVSMAFIKVLCSATNKSIEELCKYVAGHSLGEYSALCAAESLHFKDALQLVKIRGKAMQDACPPGTGSMAACIGVSIEDLQDIFLHQDSGVCEIASDNTEDQVVISGDKLAVSQVIAICKDFGKKAMTLNVSAPFHSSLMKPVAKIMKETLDQIEIHPPKIPIISNVTAAPTSDPIVIKESLVNQVYTKVRWRETIDFFANQRIHQVIEVGAGKVLTNMLKKTKCQFLLSNIGDKKGIEEFLKKVY